MTHTFDHPNEGCTKCGGFPSDPCEPPVPMHRARGAYEYMHPESTVRDASAEERIMEMSDGLGDTINELLEYRGVFCEKSMRGGCGEIVMPFIVRHVKTIIAEEKRKAVEEERAKVVDWVKDQRHWVGVDNLNREWIWPDHLLTFLSDNQK